MPSQSDSHISSFRRGICFQAKRICGCASAARDVAANLSEEYTGRCNDVVFQAGRAAPSVFDHEERKLRVYVHGEDFVIAGMPKEFKWLQESSAQKCCHS